MTTEEKELRNARILDLHNSGKSVREISKIVKMSVGGVSKVISIAIGKGEVPDKEKPIEINLTGDEPRFDSFVGWSRTCVNEYVNEKSGEVVRVAFVKGKKEGEFGYFVKVD